MPYILWRYKEVFSQTAANPNHLPHRKLVHSDFTFSAGSCRGEGGGRGTVNSVDIGNGKGSPKLSRKLKGKSKIVQLMETRC